jgi:hypothetical protein
MARDGMGLLINAVRSYSDAGTADWSNGTVNFWDDTQVQIVLDRHATSFYREQATPVITYDSGTAVYKTYWLPFQNIEGSTEFELELADGTTAGTALYTVDYMAGKITFSANTNGIAYYATGRSYDINLAAADVWRIKAANASKMFDFSTDNHSIKRGSFVKNCLEMAQYFTSVAGIQVGELERGDM